MKKMSKNKTVSGVKKLDEPIVFFGTGPVAAESLGLLLENFTIEAVITKPKPEGHRGTYPVLEVAQSHNLPIVTVSNKRELSDKLSEAKFASRVGVLIDFGIIVSQDVIDYFPMGIVNSHFSILPEWRGADPISFAILSGQNITGVSLMLLVEAMDEGPLIGYGELPLDQTETITSLTSDLISLSDALLSELLPEYVAGKIPLTEQSVTNRSVSYSRKLSKSDGILDFNKSAEALEREIRAFQEWPKSRTKLFNKDVVITAAKVSEQKGKPGSVVTTKREIFICCSRDSIKILQLKPAGKKEMTAEAFLAGHKPQIP